MNHPYFEQVRLLLRLLPMTLEDQRFGLKGGTAINLFFRDLARLSVDIDLCYLPIESRDITLQHIAQGLASLESNITHALPDCRVETKHTKAAHAKHIVVKQGAVSVKIEVNHVVRSALYPCTVQALCPAARERFHIAVTARCLSFADVYGGKLCATLDRQHPRD